MLFEFLKYKNIYLLPRRVIRTSRKDIAVSGHNHFCDDEVITWCFLNLFKLNILLYTGYEDIKQVERRSDGDGNENGKRQ